MLNRNAGFYLIAFLLIQFCMSDYYAQRSKYGAFIEPVMKIQSVLNQTSFTTGARFGFVIHERFSIGGGYYASLNSLPIAPINSRNALLHFNMGGLELESMLIDFEPVRLSVLLFAGAGALYKSASANSDIQFSTDNFLAWEPLLISNTNILNWLNINVGLGYRIITHTHGAATTDADILKGLFGIVAFKIHTR